MPIGELILEATKGPEYWPSQGNFYVHPKGVTRIELELTRMASMNAMGWWSGSDHVHMNYGGNLNNTPRVHVVRGPRRKTWTTSAGRSPTRTIVSSTRSTTREIRCTRSPDDQNLISFGEEYRPAWYGHINFINLTKHLISPFTTAYEDTGIASLYPSNTDMFALARKQGAIGGHVHPFSREPSMDSQYRVAQTYAVDVALGSFEFLEVLTSARHYTATSKVCIAR